MDYPDDYPDGEETTGGLLTRSQRGYVSDPGGYAEDNSAGSVRTMRARVRNRLQAAMYDFRLLLEYYSEDIDSMFRNAGDEEVEGMIAALGFLYRGSRPMVQRGLGRARFEDLLRLGISRAVADTDETIPHRGYVDVRLEDNQLNVERREGGIDFEGIGEKIEAGEIGDLDREQLGWWVEYQSRSGDFDPYAAAEQHQREREMLEQLREDRAESDDADESGQ